MYAYEEGVVHEVVVAKEEHVFAYLFCVRIYVCVHVRMCMR